MSKFIVDKHRPLAPATEPVEGPSSPLEIEAELDRCGEILRREIKNLMSLSSRGKLDAGASRDLVNYIKLLHDIKMDQQEKVASMTDEELLKLTK
jgi:hypothetical protein